MSKENYLSNPRRIQSAKCHKSRSASSENLNVPNISREGNNKYAFDRGDYFKERDSQNATIKESCNMPGSSNTAEIICSSSMADRDKINKNCTEASRTFHPLPKCRSNTEFASPSRIPCLIRNDKKKSGLVTPSRIPRLIWKDHYDQYRQITCAEQRHVFPRKRSKSLCRHDSYEKLLPQRDSFIRKNTFHVKTENITKFADGDFFNTSRENSYMVPSDANKVPDFLRPSKCKDFEFKEKKCYLTPNHKKINGTSDSKIYSSLKNKSSHQQEAAITSIRKNQNIGLMMHEDIDDEIAYHTRTNKYNSSEEITSETSAKLQAEEIRSLNSNVESEVKNRCFSNEYAENVASNVQFEFSRKRFSSSEPNVPTESALNCPSGIQRKSVENKVPKVVESKVQPELMSSCKSVDLKEPFSTHRSEIQIKPMSNIQGAALGSTSSSERPFGNQENIYEWSGKLINCTEAELITSDHPCFKISSVSCNFRQNNLSKEKIKKAKSDKNLKIEQIFVKVNPGAKSESPYFLVMNNEMGNGNAPMEPHEMARGQNSVELCENPNPLPDMLLGEDVVRTDTHTGNLKNHSPEFKLNQTSNVTSNVKNYSDLVLIRNDTYSRARNENDDDRDLSANLKNKDDRGKPDITKRNESAAKKTVRGRGWFRKNFKRFLGYGIVFIALFFGIKTISDKI